MGIVSRLSSGPRRAARMYAGARMNRLTQGWSPTTGSADSELWSSYASLRDRSRQLIRDNSYAKRAKLLVVNNVIGPGIGMEPKVLGSDGKPDKRVNDAIEKAWCDWSEGPNCHTGGKLAFEDLERAAFGQVFEVGEFLTRKWFSRFGTSMVPLCLELVESERLADDLITPMTGASRFYRMGIDRDEFGRPITFYLRKYHPGEFRYASAAEDPNLLVPVPADQIMHLYTCDRWPQTRGEPWLHAAMRRLNDMDGYSEAEIVRARAAACRVGIIESPDPEALPNDQKDPNAPPEFELEPGLVQRLAPGETWHESDPTSPNPNADPFMRLMLREVAAGVGVSYASMSMDYSQSNYSSSRLALLDDRDLWRVFQRFFIRSFRIPLHREWLRQAVLARAIPAISVSDYAANQAKYEAVSWKPRGWNWIDPSKEVEAAINARRAGFTSISQIIAQNGGGLDRDELWAEIQAETEDAKDMDLVFTSDAAQILARGESDGNALAPPAVVPAGGPNQPDAPEPAARVTELALVRQERMVEGLVMRLTEGVARVAAQAVREAIDGFTVPQAPQFHNHIAPQPVIVHTPDVNVSVAAPQVDVHMPEQPITVTAPDINVNVATPEVKIEMAAPQVNVTLPEQPIHVTTPDVNVEVSAPTVNVQTPEQTINVATPEVRVAAPQVNVTMPEQQINVATPEVKVEVAAPEVNVNVPDPREPTVERTFDVLERDENGFAKVVRQRSAA